MLSQERPFSHSSLASWEAPDPAFWVPHGYVLVNADLRGWGRSDGVGDLLSAQEGLDGHDLVEWAASQPWSNGRVGMTGVSYLAIVQWRTAATRPPHLCAINPWEGFTDVYRDFAYPGGVREDGFIRLWTALLRAQRRSPVTIRREQVRRPERDDWWASRTADLTAIEVPALVCASFSDHNLHSAGSFAGYLGISSPLKWLYTHRGPKWAAYYSPEALETQRRFFDHFVRDGRDAPLDEPRVRLEVRSDADTITSVRGADSWPPPDTIRHRVHLDARTGRLERQPAESPAELRFEVPRERVSFTAGLTGVCEIIGPMTLRLTVRHGGGRANLFGAIRLIRNGRPVTFEGSYGFRTDIVTHGFVHLPDDDAGRGLGTADTPTVVEVAFPPSATAILPGDELRLDLQGRWYFSNNPLRGQFPARYLRSRRQHCTIVTGADSASALEFLATPSR
jgi:predicted acyl esterase